MSLATPSPAPPPPAQLSPAPRTRSPPPTEPSDDDGEVRPPKWTQHKAMVQPPGLNCELCRLVFASQDLFISHVLGSCSTGNKTDAQETEDEAKVQSHSSQKEKMKSLGMDEYFQLCLDDKGAYMVLHSTGEDDLKVYGLTGPRRFKGLIYYWDRMFGSTPREWEDELSVLSYFPRSNWKMIKDSIEEVETQRRFDAIQ